MNQVAFLSQLGQTARLSRTYASSIQSKYHVNAILFSDRNRLLRSISDEPYSLIFLPGNIALYDGNGAIINPKSEEELHLGLSAFIEEIRGAGIETPILALTDKCSTKQIDSNNLSDLERAGANHAFLKRVPSDVLYSVLDQYLL